MKKEIICWACNEKLQRCHYENSGGEMSFPTCFFPTIASVKKYYKDFFGETFFKQTGVKMEESFSKQSVTLSHICVDDWNGENSDTHSFGEVECWTE